MNFNFAAQANFQQLVKIQRSLSGNGAESVVQPGRVSLD